MKTKFALFILLFLTVATASAQWSSDSSENTRVTNGGLLPQIITDGTGGAYIVYQDSPALLRQVWVQWLDRFGFVRFPENGMRISSADRNQTPYYYLVSDNAGGIIVLFEQLHLVGDPGDEMTFNAIYAQRMDHFNNNWFGAAGFFERKSSSFTHIGIFAHEAFHVMGWGIPNIFGEGSTNYIHSNSGDWSSMGVGYRTGPLRKSASPGDLDPVARIMMEWADPTDVNAVSGNLMDEEIK